MSEGEGSEESLAQECSSLSRYLVGLEPDAYLIGQYARFERTKAGSRAREGLGCFDRASLWLLRMGGFGARMVDSYSSRFRRDGPAFQKLVGMLALLECRPASSELLARPYSGNAGVVIARLIARGILDALTLLLSIALLGPLQLVQRFTAKRAGE